MLKMVTCLGLVMATSGCASSLTSMHATDDNQAPSAVPLATVLDALSPNVNDRRGAKLTTIVLHHTGSAGNATAVARFFQTVESKVSSHYIVDRDGTIIRCVPDSLRAWHAGVSSFCDIPNVNDYSIGIEICNQGDSVEPYPSLQMAAVTQLVAFLADTYRIPLTRITRHRDIALPPGRKIDPSDNFPFSEVILGARRQLDAHPRPVLPPQRWLAFGL